MSRPASYYARPTSTSSLEVKRMSGERMSPSHSTMKVSEDWSLQSKFAEAKPSLPSNIGATIMAQYYPKCKLHNLRECSRCTNQGQIRYVKEKYERLGISPHHPKSNWNFDNWFDTVSKAPELVPECDKCRSNTTRWMNILPNDILGFKNFKYECSKNCFWYQYFKEQRDNYYKI